MYNTNKITPGLFGTNPNPFQPTPQKVDYNALNSKIDSLNQMVAQQGITQPQAVQNVKPVQQQAKRNVLDDIATEWSSLSNEERSYIEQSDEYINANNEYHQAFNMFLLEKMSGEFLGSRFSTVPEKILSVIKTKKEEHKSNIVNDISIIKQQNAALLSKNEELQKANSEMQGTINQLRDKVWTDR